MTITLRPDLERQLYERVNAGSYPSADELINAALEQFMGREFAPGELARLVAVGQQQVAAGQEVAGGDVDGRLAAMKLAWRQGR